MCARLWGSPSCRCGVSSHSIALSGGTLMPRRSLSFGSLCAPSSGPLAPALPQEGSRCAFPRRCESEQLRLRFSYPKGLVANVLRFLGIQRP